MDDNIILFINGEKYSFSQNEIENITLLENLMTLFDIENDDLEIENFDNYYTFFRTGKTDDIIKVIRTANFLLDINTLKIAAMVFYLENPDEYFEFMENNEVISSFFDIQKDTDLEGIIGQIPDKRFYTEEMKKYINENKLDAPFNFIFESEKLIYEKITYWIEKFDQPAVIDFLYSLYEDEFLRILTLYFFRIFENYKENRPKIFKYLKDKGILNKIITDNHNKYNKELTNFLISKGADINKFLISAIKSDSDKNIKFAIENGADVNFNNGSPLFAAVGREIVYPRNFEIVELLLSEGTNPDLNERKTNIIPEYFEYKENNWNRVINYFHDKQYYKFSNLLEDAKIIKENSRKGKEKFLLPKRIKDKR